MAAEIKYAGFGNVLIKMKYNMKYITFFQLHRLNCLQIMVGVTT